MCGESPAAGRAPAEGRVLCGQLCACGACPLRRRGEVGVAAGLPVRCSCSGKLCALGALRLGSRRCRRGCVGLGHGAPQAALPARRVRVCVPGRARGSVAELCVLSEKVLFGSGLWGRWRSSILAMALAEAGVDTGTAWSKKGPQGEK